MVWRCLRSRYGHGSRLSEVQRFSLLALPAKRGAARLAGKCERALRCVNALCCCQLPLFASMRGVCSALLQPRRQREKRTQVCRQRAASSYAALPAAAKKRGNAQCGRRFCAAFAMAASAAKKWQPVFAVLRKYFAAAMVCGRCGKKCKA
ncbi:hypothetical protein NPIL_190661 [Nephila pilipes]|uniref:Uncharacterized protein n=1 Tax=Nephila pilipes TaxID=299642 RepID=A0A8X6UP19_NEPPI|nr:hypothetical protein NPIL_190661 [Nephila pilipes]